METYPSRYDLIPGTAERVMQEAKWFVIYLNSFEVFAATKVHATDNRIWYGYIVDLEPDNTFDVCESSLGMTLLQSWIDKEECEITANREQVAQFFNEKRKRFEIA